MRIRPYKFIAAAATAIWLAIPAPALAAVSPNAPSAASAGIQYLTTNQEADGKISGFGGESEWSAVAVAAAGLQASTFSHGGASLSAFLESDAAGPNTSATTLERKIIAITAAGRNPSSFGGVDYLSLLGAQHTNSQIGDSTFLNDDIFGIIAIDAAHADGLLPGAQDALDYLLAHQGADGGFSYTTAACAWCGSDNNDTAAAIIAMYAASDLGLGSSALDSARSQALVYLLSTQQADGGFGYDAYSESDGSSTAWSLMAMNTIGRSVASSASSAVTWLLGDQNADGGFSYGAYGTTTSDTYTTANAITALLGSTWLLSPQPASIPAAGGSSTPPTTSGKSGQTAGSSTKSSSQASKPRPASTKTVTTIRKKTVPSTAAKPAKKNSPQVKAASITNIKKSPLKPDPAKLDGNKKPGSSGVYFIAFLGIIAVTWFVVESQKALRRGNV